MAYITRHRALCGLSPPPGLLLRGRRGVRPVVPCRRMPWIGRALSRPESRFEAARTRATRWIRAERGAGGGVRAAAEPGPLKKGEWPWKP